jgi:hypothetical protein
VLAKRVSQAAAIRGIDVGEDVASGPNDDRKDIVMMDDFLYGEPTAVY